MTVLLVLALWSDWVGDYAGKLRWTNCTAPGKATATLALDATDAVLTIDLAPAGGALPKLSLVYDEEHGTWSAQDGEVRATLSRPRADRLDLAVDLDSGCTIRGTLARPSTGLAACDELVGWARIEARCTRRTGDPLEDFATLAKHAWTKAERTSCAARATKLAASLVDAGCAPDPDIASAGLPLACRALLDDTTRLGRCNLPPPLLGLVAQLQMLPATHPDPAQRAIAEAQCRTGREVAARIARDNRCPL